MKTLSDKEVEFLLKIAVRIVPEVAGLDPQSVDRFLGLIDDALLIRSPSVRRQFRTFLLILRWLPVVRYGVPLDSLRPERQDSVLRWFQNSPFSLIRKGFWGLKTLVFMGYYGQPEFYERFHYFPVLEGNEKLND